MFLASEGPSQPKGSLMELLLFMPMLAARPCGSPPTDPPPNPELVPSPEKPLLCLFGVPVEAPACNLKDILQSSTLQAGLLAGNLHDPLTVFTLVSERQLCKQASFLATSIIRLWCSHWYRNAIKCNTHTFQRSH